MGQADEPKRPFLSNLCLFRFDVCALSNGLPRGIYRVFVPDMALHQIAHLAISINMEMPEVIGPFVLEQTRHRGSPHGNSREVLTLECAGKSKSDQDIPVAG